ncbi:MAG TPA: alpha/beta hydrolase [Steroidobacteraceae bacterium]|nr:alpha/beta hydrolase [Steroidobacteraceae bacterium]
MNFKILLAIFKKDLRSLYPIVLLTVLLIAGDVFLTRLELLSVWASFRQPLLFLSCAVLIFAVFQLDSAVSLVDDWLCRPAPKNALLTAKLLLIFAAIYLPGVIATFIADLILGFPLKESILDAGLLQDPYVLLILPVMFLAAVVTRTVVQGIGVLIAILVCIFVIPTPLTHAPGPLDVGIGEALINAGMEWLGTAPAKLASIVLAAFGFWLVYSRRSIWAARVTLVLTAAVTLLFVLLPMWVLPWRSVFALQAATLRHANVVDVGITEPIALRTTRLCFPASRVSELASNSAFTAALQSSELRLWSDESFRDSGSDAVAFITNIEPRRLPLNWRVKLNYVEADYYANSARQYSLRPAVYITDNGGGTTLSHAWVLPAQAVHKLETQNTSLRLNYSLTLLKPRSYKLPTDGKRHAMPDLGFCSALLSAAGDHIEIDCFSAADHPAQISAELNGIPASRVFSAAEFSPAWTHWAYSQRVKLALGSPRLAPHETITLTVWEVAGYLKKSLGLPGILGAGFDTCPLPSAANPHFQKSVWRDVAPHETYSVTVDEGVQLEVLDFGGTGAPIVLLPGLGATAHSYDDIAPLLAERHRVLAITRRGAGYSSKPDFGFDTSRLAQDVLEVMDDMRLHKVVLVGSSIAGDELTWLGGRHPNRIAGLVYLDAAYDHSISHSPAADRLRELNRSLPPEPPIPPALLRDYGTLSTLMEARGHMRYPEGELIALLQVNNPYLAGVPTIDSRTQQAITAAIRPPNYGALKVPALAIYAFADPNRPLPLWYDANDKQLLMHLAEIDRTADTEKHRNIELFKQRVAHGEVLEIANAAHYVIQSNQQEVLAAIERFVKGLDIE